MGMLIFQSYSLGETVVPNPLSGAVIYYQGIFILCLIHSLSGAVIYSRVAPNSGYAYSEYERQGLGPFHWLCIQLDFS